MNGHSEQQSRPAPMLARRGGRLVPNPRYHLPLRPRLTKARRSGGPPSRARVQPPLSSPSPSPSPSPLSSPSPSPTPSPADEEVDPVLSASPPEPKLDAAASKRRRMLVWAAMTERPFGIGTPQKRCSNDDAAVDAGDKGSSSTMEASRNNGISARQSPAAFRIAYPHGRCQGRGCHGVCGGRCRPEPSVLCHCPASNADPFPELCVHCKEVDAILARATQRIQRLQQHHHDQAIAAE